MAAHANFCELEDVVLRRLGEDSRPQLPQSISRLFVQKGGPMSLTDHYHARHCRTHSLTVQSIEHLQKNGLSISLRTIERTSRLVDPTGRGISRRAVLLNANAYGVYRESATWAYKYKVEAVGPAQRAGSQRIRGRAGRLKKKQLAWAIAELLSLNEDMETAIMRANLVAMKPIIAGTM